MQEQGWGGERQKKRGNLIILSSTALGYLYKHLLYCITMNCSLLSTLRGREVLEGEDYAVCSFRLPTTHRAESGHVVGAQETSVKLNKNTRLETKGMLPSLCPNEDGNVENVFL